MKQPTRASKMRSNVYFGLLKENFHTLNGFVVDIGVHMVDDYADDYEGG